jgi:hypothetical protein
MLITADVVSITRNKNVLLYECISLEKKRKLITADVAIYTVALFSPF